MTDPFSATTAEPLVLQHRTGAVVTITLNRGDRYNPLSMDMIGALRTTIAALTTDPLVRVIVLAAAGKGFCAGHDLSEMRAHATDAIFIRRLFTECSALMMQLTQTGVPLIARVHGIASAAGCQLAAMCDLAVAADTATFALPGVNIGVFCSTPGVAVVRAIGRKRTMELLLTGAPITAATAVQWGLINAAVPSDKLDETIKTYTDSIAARSPTAISRGKRAFYRQADLPMDLAYLMAIETMTDNCGCEDASEGMDAFLQKRPAQWRGN